MTHSPSPLPKIIAALHLLPSSVSFRRDTFTRSQIIDHVLMHARMAYEAGVRAWYIQDTRDLPPGPIILPETVEIFTRAGEALRAAFPEAALGIALMQHGARTPLTIAHNVGATFVRLKVYLGTMVKFEGLLNGCAYEAIQTRHELQAGELRIIADIYDRTGEPLAPMPLPEACRQAVEFGQADGLVITGKNPDHTLSMIGEARSARQHVPIMAGGGVTTANVRQFLTAADHVIVHGAFARSGLPAIQGLPVDWDPDLIRRFVDAAAVR